MDFIRISTRLKPRGGMELYPKFIIGKSEDLMIRGGDFYAVWVEERGLWSTDEDDVIHLIDKALDDYAKEHNIDPSVRILHMWDAESGMIDAWHKYCQHQLRDNFHTLDEKLIFSNDAPNKKDYASKRLPYPLEDGPITAYDRLVSVLYSPEERHKIEWAVGAIVNGDSKIIQKFLVLYGAAGTGKSTVINIIEQLFTGYFSVFDSRALGSTNNAFALEAFKSNPLVAIQHDGDLSHIEDNTKLNSLVSHEMMTVNNKYEKMYQSTFKSFLIMATNKPVRITDAKSGLIRRLIDVSPTGNLIPKREYDQLKSQVKFELGGIAKHCLDVYNADKDAYDDYIPLSMMGATNDFFNFVLDSYSVFDTGEGVTLNSAYALYNAYCDDAKVQYPYSKRIFKEELKNYFEEFKERKTLDDGTRARNYYEGFKKSIFDEPEKHSDEHFEPTGYTSLESDFDILFADCPAQYAGKDGFPLKKWENVKTKLRDLDTSKLHYILPTSEPQFVCIDFDLKDEDGNKSQKLNLEAASKFPPTYGEYSKSGAGIHLCYIYDGDTFNLSPLYSKDIEVKVFRGNSSLRRKFSYSNGLPIAHLQSGLPMKGEKKVVDKDIVQTERGLRTTIKQCLKKEHFGNTTQEVSFIKHCLDNAYDGGLKYDVSDLFQKIETFAANSSHQKDNCLKMVAKMRFKSDDIFENTEKSIKIAPAQENVDSIMDASNYPDYATAPIVFFDCEVFPNLFLVNWKYQGEDKKVVRMINPSPAAIENLFKFRLIGFNNRRYDNHILYARMMGYSNKELFNLSNKIVSNDKNAFFGAAYNVSYTDIYDYCSKKQSLKKWEIELGIHHQELGLPWDQEVPENRWVEVAEYCDNDVIATEAVFNATQADFTARQMLADIAGMTVNDTTNSLTTRIIFGNDRNPQEEFNYRFMGDMSEEAEIGSLFDNGKQMMVYDPPDEWTRFDKNSRPLFPGYKFEAGKSTYRDEEVGEGGYVDSLPGIHGNVALLDIASMHPSSAIAENLFGKYTKNFEDLVQARLYIKHKDYDSARKMLGGKLAPYLKDEKSAEQLSKVLKIPINSVYGLTAASFTNAFRDPRNVDNIVAKRGALFMINLKHEVINRGFTVAHIKTDSIKIPNATLDIIKFVMDYGKMYGYTFEHEATYDKMCLVNDAVYIARYATVDKCRELYGAEYVDASRDICKENKKHEWAWTATGAQFAVPYLFKTLFSHEPIIFEDLCETKSVTSGSIYLDMNEELPDVSGEEEIKKYYEKIKKDPFQDMKRPSQFKQIDFKNLNIEELDATIAKGHNYIFIGRVGLFCPIKKGCGGGLLMREKDGKYYSVTGTKGYRWLEAEQVKTLGKENDIDTSYYDKLCAEAVASIEKYGYFDWFVSDVPYDKDYNHIYPF